MARKRRYLYLYLTLACFLGLIAIFLADGYMGIYDTVSVLAGEQEQKIEADYWLQQDRFWSTGIQRGEKALFTYTVDNRQFSSYTADIQVSAWHSQEKVRDLLSQQMTISPFAKGELQWSIDAAEFLPADIPAEQSYDFTVVISRGDIERRIIVYINPAPYPLKPPVPTRVN